MAGVLDELLQNVRQNDSDWKNTKAAIVLKGVPVPDGTPTSEYGEKILSIETGVDTSGDTVVPSALREGFTAHNAAGQEITGTIPNYDGAITEGAVPGAQAKYEEGVADGKQEQYDAFWDAFQQNGTRTEYNRAFAYGWSAETFDPKFPIIPEGDAGYMFYYSKIGKLTVGDFDFVERGIELDFSKATNVTYCFGFAVGIKRLGVIDFSGVTSRDYNRPFFSTRIETIDKLVVKENVAFDHSFDSSSYLKNLTIEGTIGQNGFNTAWSPLSKASLTSIVNALSSTTTGLTVTLRLAAVNTAFETAQGSTDGSSSEEWLNLIATKSNWTINLINS